MFLFIMQLNVNVNILYKQLILRITEAILCSDIYAKKNTVNKNEQIVLT